MAEDFDRLKLAFAVTLAKSIIDADERTDYSEFKLFGQLFPRMLLQDAGFLDDAGRFTPELADAWTEAHRRLPAELSHGEKLDVLTIFYGTSVADDDLDARELEVIREAATLLGVSMEELSRHISGIRTAGG